MFCEVEAKVAKSTFCWFKVCCCHRFASTEVLLSLFIASLSTGPSWKEPFGPILAFWSL